MQMIGRAGRPGYDSTGVAVVLTDNSSKQRIEHLLESGFGPAESNLCARLPEVMNAQISQQEITSAVGAVRWLQTTFLFSCMKRNEKNPNSLIQKLSNDAIQDLKNIGIIEEGDQRSIRPRAGSYIMNQYSVSYKEMKEIASFTYDTSQCQILRSISKLEAVQSYVRRNERAELKSFYKTDSMKYKLPGPVSKFSVKGPSEKAFILLQSYISRHKFKNQTLLDQQSKVGVKGRQILQVAQAYCAQVSKHGKIALECCKLHRSFNLRLWDQSFGVFNQIECIGSAYPDSSNKLIFNGIRSFEDATNSSEEEINKILGDTQQRQNQGRELKESSDVLCRQRLRVIPELIYTAHSNVPAELICTLKYDDHGKAMKMKDKEKNIAFSLLAFTDNPLDSKLIFEQNICSPSTFRYEMQT